MKIEEAIRVLKEHQKWRRGCDETPATVPSTLGKALDVAIESLHAGMQWRDIKSAPRDGTQIIVNAPQIEAESTYAYFEKGHWHLAYDGKRFGLHVQSPTHWMPVPLPPESD